MSKSFWIETLSLFRFLLNWSNIFLIFFRIFFFKFEYNLFWIFKILYLSITFRISITTCEKCYVIIMIFIAAKYSKQFFLLRRRFVWCYYFFNTTITHICSSFWDKKSSFFVSFFLDVSFMFFYFLFFSFKFL